MKESQLVTTIENIDKLDSLMHRFIQLHIDTALTFIMSLDSLIKKPCIFFVL